MTDAAGYEKVCQDASTYLSVVLEYSIVTRTLGPVDLWEHLDREDLLHLPIPGGVDHLDPNLTILQWSIALDHAREKRGLPPFGTHEVVIAGVMSDPLVRDSVRLVSRGHVVGGNFMCPCGWYGPLDALAIHLYDHRGVPA